MRKDDRALRLVVAVGRLRARVRDEAGAGPSGLPLAHLTILKQLRADGASTAAALAAVEHVSQQAVAQRLAALERDGLVRRRPDPSDRRKSLVSLTAAGAARLDAVRASRAAWLVRAIDAAFTPAERAELDRAVVLLERLADVHLGPDATVR